MTTIPHFVLFAFVTFSLVGLNPLASSNEIDQSEAAGGSLLRQVILLGLCALIVPLVVHRLKYFRTLLVDNSLLVLIVAWAGLSVSWALAPDIALRRWALALVVIFLVTALSALVNDTRRIHHILLIATGLVMIANFLVALALPHIGLGLDSRGMYWTGIQPHKNGAGVVAAIATMVWFFAWRRFAPSWFFLGGAAFWIFFLSQTGARTSQFALVVAIGCTMMLSLKNQYFRRAAIFTVLFITVVGMLTLLTGVLPVDSALAAMFGDTTFTGRTVLWSFLVSQIHQRPFLGVGFGSFWGVSEAGPVNASKDDWFSATVQGHNGYLDIAVTIGLVGLVLCLVFLLLPFRSLGRSDRRVQPSHQLFCALWIFALVHNSAESTILRGDSILWILTLFSVIALKSIRPRAEEVTQLGPPPLAAAFSKIQRRFGLAN